MDHIIAIFHPFEIEQEIAVYQHGECIKQIHPCLEDTVNAIYQLYQQYHIDKIELCGNPSFISKYIKDLKGKYSNMPEVEIISQ